ncbi:MAG TPA: hypothetical protein VE134_09160 [Methanomicrobiales archaeon]|nr:hypothetical protein [Methanomicrobiales archaeon]
MAEERVSDLESKVREMEALMKGLTEELLDLKTIVMKLHAKDEERRAAVQRSVAPPVRPRSAPEPAKQKVAEPGELELIMQSDGTLKPEGRQRSGLIVASPRYSGLSSKGKKKGQIVSDDGKKKSGDLIYAVDEEEKSKE